MSTQPRKRVGLALGGGIARGLAHVGVVSALVREGIPIDLIAGTSAGSLVGLQIAAGQPLERLQEIADHMSWRRIARPVWPRRGFVSFEPMEAWLNRELNHVHFEDLRIPFVVLATDLEEGLPVELCQGEAARAVRASCSVPGFVEPVEIAGRMLGDGSLADTVPVDALRRRGADYVIGVDIFVPALHPRGGPWGMLGTMIEILVQRAGGGIDQADCLIRPAVKGRSFVSFKQRTELYRLGEAAALEKIPQIRRDLGLGVLS